MKAEPTTAAAIAAMRPTAGTAAGRKPLSGADMRRTLDEASRTVRQELTDVPLAVQGELPAGLDGVLFRNGPGRFERGGQRYAHPFDGDGHIVRLDIGPKGVRYSNRFVRTAEFVAEEAAGRMCFRGFGSNLPGGLLANLLRMRFKNAANTSVVWHAGRLLALWEGGAPHRLDPHTLDTLGTEDFDGGLRNPLPPPARWLSGSLPFAAHPRLDAVTGELFSFGLMFGVRNRLFLYRVDRDGQMAPPRMYPLPRFSFVHDFAVTRRWLCFLLPHADFDVPRALLGLSTPVGSLRLATERPMQALLIPRAGGAPRLLDCGPGFVFHIAQGFDRDDGALVLDVLRYVDYPAFDDLDTLFADPPPDSLPHLERLVLEPDTGRFEVRSWTERGAELPTTESGALGEPRRFIYSIGAPRERRAPFFTAIQRLDTETGELRVLDLAPDLPGEPIPVAGADGGAGWLLSLVHRAGQSRTDLLVLRTSDLSIVATASLPQVVPLGFHGCWVPRAEIGSA
jgi:all-trans-8'-apo-beta-carotenal 15,15'-oxygenase